MFFIIGMPFFYLYPPKMNFYKRFETEMLIAIKNSKLSIVKAFLPAYKNTGVVLLPCLHMESIPTAISDGVDISEVPEYYVIRKMSSL